MSKLTLNLLVVLFTVLFAACGTTTTTDAGAEIENGKDCSAPGASCKSGICATQGCNNVDGGTRQICASSVCTTTMNCPGTTDNCVAFPGNSLCIPACP